MTQKLYRPYLSLPELNLLCSLLSTNLQQENATPLYGKLFKLKLEAEIGLRKEAYSQKPSLLEKLQDIKPQETILPSQELWETLNKNPSSLSPAQIRAAKTWGWQQDLMGNTEKLIFEKEMGF